MKKLATLLLALLMVFSLAACGGTTTDSGTVSANKLTVWCWDPTFNIYAMEEAAKIYKKDNPDVEIEIVEVPWANMQVAITTAGQAGDYSSLPDILLCQNNAFQKNVTNFPEMFVDISGSGIAFKDFGESSLAYSTVDGKNYGVPFDNGTAINALRVDIIEEAGYTIEDFTDITWDEYITMGEDVLAKTGKALQSGVAGETDTMMVMLQSVGGSLFDEDGNAYIKDNEKLKACIETYIEMVEKGILVETNVWDEYVSSFVNEEVAGTMNGCWILGSVQTDEAQSGKWAITNIPKLDMEGGTNYSTNGGSSWAVTSNTANADLATDFLSKTFAGSVELYDTILHSSGAIANYMPAAGSDVYQEPQEFFGGDTIYAKIVEYGSKVPTTFTGVYYYEARDAVGVAITQVIQGTDIDVALAEAQGTLEFEMQ